MKIKLCNAIGILINSIDIVLRWIGIWLFSRLPRFHLWCIFDGFSSYTAVMVAMKLILTVLTVKSRGKAFTASQRKHFLRILIWNHFYGAQHDVNISSCVAFVLIFNHKTFQIVCIMQRVSDRLRQLNEFVMNDKCCTDYSSWNSLNFKSSFLLTSHRQQMSSLVNDSEHFVGHTQQSLDCAHVLAWP
jgi:hypothetical protein